MADNDLEEYKTQLIKGIKNGEFGETPKPLYFMQFRLLCFIEEVELMYKLNKEMSYHFNGNSDNKDMISLEYIKGMIIILSFAFFIIILLFDLLIEQ